MKTADRSGEAARQLDISSALLALAVLCDSAIEHYRGSFHNKAMYAPLVTSAAAVCAGLLSPSGRPESRPLSSSRPQPSSSKAHTAVQLLTAGVGCAGLAFHFYNVFKRPGKLSWLNLFYAAPIGAPAALVLSGLMSRSASQVRNCERAAPTATTTSTLGRRIAGVTAVGLLGTVGEAALFHFRGAYRIQPWCCP